MILVILGILAVVAVPRFTGSAPYEARGYFDELASAARYAQLQATVSGCPASFQISGGDYQLSHDAACPGGSQAIPHPSRGGPFAGQAPANVSVSDLSVTFDALGVPDSAGSVQVSGGGFNGSFQVHAQTGFVQVQP